MKKKRGKKSHTDDKSGKEGIDPAHNQGLRNHHGHVPFHHAHHALHSRRVRHGVPSRFPSVFGVFKEGPVFVGRHQVRPTRGKGGGRDDVGVGAEIDAAQESALFAEGGKTLLFGNGCEQYRRVVAEDTS